MAYGTVRKVDELGRVVIPKEMRRILNIKTGSSIEMFINDENQVVLKKFSEIKNIIFFAEILADLIFDNFKIPCLISDDEKILVVKGVSKKDFLGKQILEGSLKFQSKDYLLLESPYAFLNEQNIISEKTYVFNFICEGFECGYLFLFSQNEIEQNTLQNIKVLTKFLSGLLNS